MHKIHSKKGIDFKIQGRPGDQLIELGNPGQVAVTADKLPLSKARLQVKPGDRIACGGILLEDKKRPWLKFLSPAGGRISQINYGPRRVIKEIVIDLDEDEQYLDFDSFSRQRIETAGRQEVVDAIVAGGLWWALRCLPFRDVPEPDVVPPQILVGLTDKEPFAPRVGLVIRENQDLLRTGVAVLRKLAPKVVVYTHADSQEVLRTAGDLVNLVVRGRYPAGDPAAVVYRIKQSAAENRSWYIDYQDLLLVAELLTTGRFPTRRIFAVGGTRAPFRGHFKSRLGVPLKHLVDTEAIQPGSRLIAGGILTGYSLEPEGFMGIFETGLAILPADRQPDFLALFRPGFNKPTNSRAFVSWMRSRDLEYDCGRQGPERACISCMYCADVCPVDILPQMLYKAILAQEVEEYLAHGLLDCVQCGLCSYVCPSKIELAATFRQAGTDYARQVSG